MIKVFQINDCDWYAGDCTKEEILAVYMEDTGCSLDEATGMDDDYPIELTPEQMENIKFNLVCEDGTEQVISFQDQLDNLLLASAEFPCFFASTVY